MGILFCESEKQMRTMKKEQDWSQNYQTQDSTCPLAGSAALG